MSNQEQDEIVGRLIREKGEALRLKVALDSEIKSVADVCESVMVRAHSLKPEEVAVKLESIRKYFNVDAYLGLLRERARVEADVLDRIKRLRALGAAD